MRTLSIKVLIYSVAWEQVLDCIFDVLLYGKEKKKERKGRLERRRKGEDGGRNRRREGYILFSWRAQIALLGFPTSRSHLNTTMIQRSHLLMSSIFTSVIDLQCLRSGGRQTYRTQWYDYWVLTRDTGDWLIMCEV